MPEHEREIKNPCCDGKVTASVIRNGFEGRCPKCDKYFIIDVGARFMGSTVIMPKEYNPNK